MKTKIISVLFVFFLGQLAVSQKTSAQADVNFQVFYDELSPYGTWINNPDYGYVWAPNLSPGFIPYATNGYWIFTDDGWTWVSDYAWGWAPFHYGRWYTDDVYGPVWIPDYQWSPAWVTWRRSGAYYGWAPLGPHRDAGYDGHDIPNNRWTFANGRDLGRKDINTRYVNTSNNVSIFKNSTVINNIRTDNVKNVKYDQGPDKAEVEKIVGKPIKPVPVKENDKPGQSMEKDHLKLYRPKVQQNDAGPKPAPAKVGKWEDVKTLDQRRTENPEQRGGGEQNRKGRRN